MEDRDYREQFIDSAEAYEKTIQTKHIRLIYELEKQTLEKLFSKINSRGKSVMDFACGTGRWTEFLEKHFKEIAGIDVSENMIQIARQKCKKASFFVTDITSENTDKEVLGKKFDVITSFRFYKNAQKQLRQQVTEVIPKYLKQDGLFIFDLHLNTFSFMGILATIMHLLRLHRLFKIGELTIRTISLGDIKRLFKDTPLKIIDYYGMGILPGRSNYTVLPQKLLYKTESFFTNKRILRRFAYNILVIAQKK
jgi:2-polyprenyl-3-methyl-5-hydroxy-6-metoxy-1,4-benzoquinol methylase